MASSQIFMPEIMNLEVLKLKQWAEDSWGHNYPQLWLIFNFKYLPNIKSYLSFVKFKL